MERTNARDESEDGSAAAAAASASPVDDADPSGAESDGDSEMDAAEIAADQALAAARYDDRQSGVDGLIAAIEACDRTAIARQLEWGAGDDFSEYDLLAVLAEPEQWEALIHASAWGGRPLPADLFALAILESIADSKSALIAIPQLVAGVEEHGGDYARDLFEAWEDEFVCRADKRSHPPRCPAIVVTAEDDELLEYLRELEQQYQ